MRIINKSSNRMTIGLPGTSPTLISGERSIENIRRMSPYSGLISVIMMIGIAKIREILKSGADVVINLPIKTIMAKLRTANNMEREVGVIKRLS